MPTVPTGIFSALRGIRTHTLQFLRLLPLPVGLRAHIVWLRCCLTGLAAKCRWWESNPHYHASKACASANWATTAIFSYVYLVVVRDNLDTELISLTFCY